MGIEAAREQDHLRLPGLDQRHQCPLEGGDVLGVARSGRERQVHGRAFAPTPANLADVAGSRVEGELVTREIEDIWIFVERVLGAVAVVHVPVENHHPLQALLGLEGPRRDRHVVEQAEAHGVIRLGVVARGTHGGQTVSQLTAGDATGQFDTGPGGEQGDVVALGADVGVGVEAQGGLLRGLFHPGQVVRRVDPQDLIGSRGTRRDGLEGFPSGVDGRVDRAQAVGALGMVGRPRVLAKARIFDDGGCPAGDHRGAWYPRSFRIP